MRKTAEVNVKPLLLAGALLGVGLGGFIDGIVFHQILQTHSMMSADRPPISSIDIEINMFWDGLFHLVTWSTTLAGVIVLFAAGRRADRFWNGPCLAGAMLVGWGLFNLVEGGINHHILHLHHVVERFGVSVFDVAFLGSGVVLMLVGCAMIRRTFIQLEGHAVRRSREDLIAVEAERFPRM